MSIFSYLFLINRNPMKILPLLLGLMFSAFLSTAQEDNCACCTDDHKAFDFWLGTWEVTLPNGNKAGQNLIEKIQGGCVLRENWTGANGNFTGTSYNFYNPGTGLWEQLWLDVAGTILKLKGQRTGDQMIMESEETINEDKSVSTQRITWTLQEDGKVRQVWEVLKDGVSAQVLFDGLYSRKE
ncbi:hypothetical protein GCM10011361_23830 [Muriicola marianensis]|uniref:DUF1579 domain-containing protein n=2 Tax=Muriicola marianensis TaxID=1324801 RepID=A0ABQ1R5D6_9FLAO|nr:hypothetical protein GCM10011361_23830 [Muriicola marianensis]